MRPGELSFFYDLRAEATAEALKNTTCLLLDRATYDRVKEHFPAECQTVRRRVLEHARARATSGLELDALDRIDTDTMGAGGALGSHAQALGVRMGELQQLVQHEVGVLKAGQQQAQQDIGRLQETQQQVMARLESILVAVEKLQAALGDSGQVVN